MTNLATFNQATISCSLAQEHYKLVLAALSVLEQLSNEIKHPDVANTLSACLKHAQKDLGFNLDLADMPKLKHETGSLMSNMLDSYTEKRWEYIDLANEALASYARENFHPDIYNLANGESLKVEV